MWSAALEAILTTLRYLTPATLLTLFWGQESFLFKLLKSIDNAFRAIVFSSEEQKEDVLKWLAEAGPVRVEHLDTVWRHGWILCGVLDASLPGACAGHPPTRLSLKHAQSIADHYLGVEPVFSRQELESNDSLSKHQEWKLATFLDRVRQALAKVSPPVSKPQSQRTSPETSQFTLDYVARGSGLIAAQVRNKAFFKIYPTAQQCLDPGEITILIRGPRDTYGMSVIPPIFGKAQLIRQKLLGLQTKPIFTENALPITQGATYLRSYGKNDMNKTYFIPKEHYDIEIEVDSKPEVSKIGYTVNYEGKYEISITSRGQHIVGSPFSITASYNIIDILHKESFCLEDGEEIDIVDVKSDRKVVLRIVDFVTEKMLLNENGSLEKISDDEAKILMAPDEIQDTDDATDSQLDSSLFTKLDEPLRPQRFNTTAQKILKMNRVCKMFNSIMAEKQELLGDRKDTFINQRKDVPDIVNSTLSEANPNRYVVNVKRDTFIIPKNISVALLTEKSTALYKHVTKVSKEDEDTVLQNEAPIVVDSREDKNLFGGNVQEDDISMISSSSNPFLNEIYEQNYVTEKALGSFLNTEYEANRSQHEETAAAGINIFVEETHSDDSSPINTNPFIEPHMIERPKTPILKILTGNVTDRDDVLIYGNKKIGLETEDLQGNEFINPFFMHQHHHSTDEDDIPCTVTDFIIGAPVSLPPILRAPTPEPTLSSLMITSNENIGSSDSMEQNVQECTNEIYSTPLHTNTTKQKEYYKSDRNSTESSTFHSLDSCSTENVEIINITAEKHRNADTYELPNINTSLTPKKDMWDSAYVSIDDSNSSPDTNNNENTGDIPKQKRTHGEPIRLKSEELIKMGPAERELWLTCSELNINDGSTIEEQRPHKTEMKRMLFTPIIEESDRCVSSGMKDLSRGDSTTKQGGLETITVAFAELNDMYHEYFPSSDNSSLTTINDDNIKQSNEIKYTVERNDIYVDSASDQLSDVKRRANQIEGEISEVQSNVTESVSVSQALPQVEQNIPYESTKHATGEFHFGTDYGNNIVLEKKKYWDDKIRQIEAKSDEIKANQKKRRLSAKHLRQNDSLTKRRGKDLAKKFLSGGDDVTQNVTEIIRQKYQTPQVSIEKETPTDVKLVEKWKKYWDEKLEVEREETESVRSRSRSPRSYDSPVQSQVSKVIPGIDNNGIKSHSLPAKQDLPEEVFKAFETSPKRFFGTSRKQILNKLDAFFGKPSAADQSSEDGCGAKYESGLVSSRISLFHNISQKEEVVPWNQRKSRSMHNIYHRKDSEKSVASSDEVLSIDVGSYQYEELKQNTNETINSVDTTLHKTTSEEMPSIKEKRARMTHKIYHKTFDETTIQKSITDKKPENNVKKNIKSFDNQSHCKNTATILCKTKISKSDMDIFNKVVTKKVPEDDLDKYKSCEELPKINVKNFISLYETVSKTSTEQKVVRKPSMKNTNVNPLHVDRQNSGVTTKPVCTSSSSTSSSCSPINSSSSGISTSPSTHLYRPDSNASYNEESKPIKPRITHRASNWIKSNENHNTHKSLESETSMDSIDIEIISMPDTCKQSNQSLSDIDLEIVENNPEMSKESSPDKEIKPELKDYKSRFTMAKNYFKSLEELREDKKPLKLNECELLLLKTSNESLDSDTGRPQRRVKNNIKAHSAPSSEISKVWNEMQKSQDTSSNCKLVKISEKFHVDDLFNDVMEGRLSRQGSLRGIPHKKAVLETFRSMENVSVNKMSSYEIAISQLSQFAKENKIKNAQTYLTEYPYLPTTDPSKYHSRFDTKASGLISMKELLNEKPRRNSVPDLRLNPTFTVDL